MKSVGKPDAVVRHVRFDERGWETERWQVAPSDRAHPQLYHSVTAAEIDPTGRLAIGVGMDVSDEQQVDVGTAQVISTFGCLDILVSNAGIQIVAPIVDFEFAKWKKRLAIHLDGADGK